MKPGNDSESTGEFLAWLTACVDADERAALAASSTFRRQATGPEHWRWECTEDDEPLDVDLAIASNDELLTHDGDHYRVGLRSIEEYPSPAGRLCHLVIDGEEVSPQVARHLARHDPARVLREVEAKRRRLSAYQDAVRMVAEFPADRTLAAILAERLGACQQDASVYSDQPGYKPEWGS